MNLMLDARTGRDPTGTSKLRASFRATGRVHLGQMRAAIRSGLIDHDVLALRRSNLPVMIDEATRLQAFHEWLRVLVGQHLVTRWPDPFIARAWDAGHVQALQDTLGPAAIQAAPGVGPSALQRRAYQELTGIGAAIVQQVSRTAAIALATKAKPLKAASMVRVAFDKIATDRVNALANTLVVGTFNRAKLETYRAAGVDKIGIIPETEPKPHSDARVTRDARHLSNQERDVFRRALRLSTQPRDARGRKPKLPEPDEDGDEGDVEIEFVPEPWTELLLASLTAGDDKVCFRCEDIAEDAPYTLDEALELLPAHANCRCALVPWTGKPIEDAAYEESKHPRDPHGRWASGGRQEAAKLGLHATNPSAFILARNRTKYPQFLSPIEPGDLKDHLLLMSADHTYGVAIDPHGDIQNVFNNGGPKRAGQKALMAAIANGGRTLDCFDPYLPTLYRQFGFRETGRMKFNDDYAPKGWDYERRGRPDVVFMHWAGYDRVDPFEHATNEDDWLTNERTSKYFDDYDQAKAATRLNAERTQDHRSSGAARTARTFIRARDQYGAGSGARHRRSVTADFTPAQWAEELHPRAWHGRWSSKGKESPYARWYREHPRAMPSETGPAQQELWPGKFPPLPEPGTETVLPDFKKAKIDLDRSTENSGEKSAKFLKTWNERVHEAPDDFRDEFLGGMKGTMKIDYDDYNDSLELTGSLLSDTGNSIAQYTRVINFKDNSASSDYFSVTSSRQGKDIGKRMLAANVAMYQKLGLDQVEVHANIDVGGYAWAKYGYVPTESSWDDLRGSFGEGGGEASSWEELTDRQQDEIEKVWRRDTFDEFYQSDEENWRDQGGDLAHAKAHLAGVTDKTTLWAKDAIGNWVVTGNDGKPLPISSEKILEWTSFSYEDRRGDGEGDPEVTIDDQFTPELTEDQRAEIEDALVDAFNKQAEKIRGDLDPPEYLTENVESSQHDYWQSMRDRDKFKWAEDNDAIPERDSSVGDVGDEHIRAILDDSDPKGIWEIADSKYGKDMLLGTDWHGYLDLNDSDTMARFNAYVAKRKK